MKKILPFANVILLCVMIVVSYLGNAGWLTGNTMKMMSNRYPTLITPAGFAFSIWGVIYAALAAFVIFSALNPGHGKKVLHEINWWFAISCVFNTAWVFAWLSDFTGLSVLLMMGLLYSLIMIIVNTRMELDTHPLKHYLFVYWPFAIYAGWVSVALMVNISAWLVKMDWSAWGINEELWAVGIIFLAGILNICLVLTRNLREFATAGIWALFGISVSNQFGVQSFSVRISCYLVIAVTGLVIIRSGFKNKSRSASAM